MYYLDMDNKQTRDLDAILKDLRVLEEERRRRYAILIAKRYKLWIKWEVK